MTPKKFDRFAANIGLQLHSEKSKRLDGDGESELFDFLLELCDECCKLLHSTGKLGVLHCSNLLKYTRLPSHQSQN